MQLKHFSFVPGFSFWAQIIILNSTCSSHSSLKNALGLIKFDPVQGRSSLIILRFNKFVIILNELAQIGINLCRFSQSDTVLKRFSQYCAVMHNIAQYCVF